MNQPNIQTYKVYPTKKYNRAPTPPKIPLHALDPLTYPLQIKNHRFFRPPRDLSLDVISHTLTSSLAEALELYPSAAGIITKDEDGRTVITTEPVGTPFLVETKDTPFSAEEADVGPRSEMLLPSGATTFAAKLTQYSCGTICVASSINHQVVDLGGYLDFLEVWAQIARGEEINLASVPNDFTHTPGRFFPDMDRYTALSSQPPPGYSVLPELPTGGPPFVAAKITRWQFSPSSLEELKKDLSPPPSSGTQQWISSGDGLVSIAAGAITRARIQANLPRCQSFGGSSAESDTDAIAMAADGRSRAPGDKMNRQYFGNFNILPIVAVRRSDLQSPTIEAASRVALSIRNGLQDQLSVESIAHKIAFMENPAHLNPPGRIIWSSDVTMTNWSKFDLQDARFDLGWGKPFLATDGSSASMYPPGYVLFMRDSASGGVLAMLTIEEAGFEGLKADPLMNLYAACL